LLGRDGSCALSWRAISRTGWKGTGSGTQANPEGEACATILQRTSAPLKKADLQVIAQYLVAHLSYNQVPALAKRHKVEVKKNSDSAQELLAKQVNTYDEAELCKLLVEISLLDSAISDPQPTATTFLWASPNVTEWTREAAKGRGWGTRCQTCQEGRERQARWNSAVV
jgi:hypothetical protein